MRKNKINGIYFILGYLVAAITIVGAPTDNIRLNQIGFYPDGPKYGLTVDSGSEVFYITSPDLVDTVFTGSLGAAEVWSHSGETVRLINFTEFETPGEYTVVVPDVGQSYIFCIADYIHQDLTAATVKEYYFLRASTALSEEHAGKWNRPAGHLDTQVWVHASAATEARPENTIISSSKGWYDAGDYNKYIVDSGISTYTILAAYEHFPEYFRGFEFNIPESGNNIPDILDEALWNISWMLTMQDPNDGGVYHKLTTVNFSGIVMPHQATARRYVVQKSTPATLDFAAVMAQASRIFQDFNTEMPGFADKCLATALEAWNWARQNPNIHYSQSALNAAYNPDINTGEYGDGNFTDEFQWASAELFITTRADSFLTLHNPLSGFFGLPWWGGVNTLGLYSLAFHRAELGNGVDTATVVSALLGLVEGLRDEVGTSAYHVVMGESNGNFVWGSNGIAANQGMALIQAYNMTGDTTFLEAAMQNLDYLLGRNATGFCFVTGFGSKSPMHPHHRPSEADSVVDPIPGLLVGGPNPGREDGCSGYLGTERAKSYVDDWCSYASNENAINWNAPLVYLSGAIEALNSPTGQPNPTAVHKGDESNSMLPEGFGLFQNTPNPFNNSTRIRYRLPQKSHVHLEIFNIRGRKVDTLVNRIQEPGLHEAIFQTINLSSGLYICRLQAGLAVQKRRMVFLK